MKYIVSGGNASAGVNMRTKPSKNGSVIAVIKQGTEVQVTEVGESWCKVKYKDKTGYIMTEYLKDVEDQMDNVGNTIEVDYDELKKIHAQIGNMLKGLKAVKN